MTILQQSRPVGAESFLLKTVQCTVGSLLGDACPPSTQSNATAQPAGSSSGNSAGNNSAKRSNGTMRSSTPTSGANTDSTGGSGVSGATIDTAPAPLGAVPSLPSAGGTASALIAGSTPVASLFPYGVNTQSMTAKYSTPSLETSDQGWRILGLAWYAWLAIIGAVAWLGWRIIAALRRRPMVTSESL